MIPDGIDLLDPNNLKNLDEKSVLSLNGMYFKFRRIKLYHRLIINALACLRLSCNGSNSTFGAEHSKLQNYVEND
jgi:poly(A) polymerase Pap1